MPLVIWRKFSFMSCLLRAFIIYRCDYMVFLFTYLFLIQHSPILHNLWRNLSAVNSLVAISALVCAVQSSKYPAQPWLSIRSGYPHILLPLLSPCTAPPPQCPALHIPAPPVSWTFFYLLSFGRLWLCLDWWQPNALRQRDGAVLGLTVCVSFPPGSQSCSAWFSVPFKNITISGKECKRERSTEE